MKFLEIDEEIEDQKGIQYKAETPLVLRIYDKLTESRTFRINEISNKIEFKEKKSKHWLQMEDTELNSMWLDFQLDPEFKGREKPSDKILLRLINSNLTEKFNAINQYFLNNKYQGTGHIEALAKTIIIDKIINDQNYNIYDEWFLLFKRWMVASVACMLGKSPNHVMLLLSGGQGIGKTTWLNRLCPPELDKDYRVTGHINPDLKDDNTANFLAEKIFINIDDQLDNIMNRDFNQIKSIITVDKINNRKKYAHFEKSRKRIANLIGSVNQDRIFIDNENRRYLFLKVTDIDMNHNVNIDHVWAEVYQLLMNGERYYFNSEEIRKINLINDYFSKIPAEHEFFNMLYEAAEPTDPAAVFVQFSEILSNIKNYSGLNMREHMLSISMKKIGMKSVSKRNANGYPRYVYPVKEKFTKDIATNKIMLMPIMG